MSYNLVFWGNVFIDGIINKDIVQEWLEQNYDPSSGQDEKDFLEQNLLTFIQETNTAHPSELVLRAGDNTANVASSFFNLDPETGFNLTYMAPVGANGFGDNKKANDLFFSEMPASIDRVLFEQDKNTAHLLAIIDQKSTGEVPERDFARFPDSAYSIDETQFKKAVEILQNADVFFTSGYELREEKYQTTLGLLKSLKQSTLRIFDAGDYGWLGNSIEKSVKQGAKYHIFMVDQDLGKEKRDWFYENADTKIFIQTKGSAGSTIYIKRPDSQERKYEIPVHFFKKEISGEKQGNTNGAGDAYLSAFSHVLLNCINAISAQDTVKGLDCIMSYYGVVFKKAGEFASYVAGEKCQYDTPRIPQEHMKQMWKRFSYPTFK